MWRSRKTLYRLISIAMGTVLLFTLGLNSLAQDDAGSAEAPATEEVVAAEEAVEEEVVLTAADVQTNLDLTWVLLAGFLVFFMQAGFAMLEAGMIQHTGVVNSMAENFIDACVTALVFFAVGYGLAFGDTSGGIFGTTLFFLDGIDGTLPEHGAMLVMAFYQFAFCGAAATIATGAMAERTDFKGKMMYTGITAVFIYPIVVHWVWQGSGWLTNLGFMDFAGSTVVHQTGGMIALIGAMMVGPRVGRVFGSAPKPHNLLIATLGTFILWFGWYGFNVGSTLAAGAPNIMGLVAINTTLAAGAGALGGLFYLYVRTKKWDLPAVLNGSLAGLVGITAPCAFVSPTAAVIIGAVSGVVVMISIAVIERLKIDDAAGAFSVHGTCGALGTLAIGFWALPSLTGGPAGLFAGGGFDQLIIQATGVLAVTAWVAVTATVMFGAIKVLGWLRIPAEAEKVGIDAYEHGASVWPDVLPLRDEPAGAGD